MIGKVIDLLLHKFFKALKTADVTQMISRLFASFTRGIISSSNYRSNLATASLYR